MTLLGLGYTHSMAQTAAHTVTGGWDGTSSQYPPVCGILCGPGASVPLWGVGEGWWARQGLQNHRPLYWLSLCPLLQTVSHWSCNSSVKYIESGMCYR